MHASPLSKKKMYRERTAHKALSLSPGGMDVFCVGRGETAGHSSVLYGLRGKDCAVGTGPCFWELRAVFVSGTGEAARRIVASVCSA